jgi:hypothetical protein
LFMTGPVLQEFCCAICSKPVELRTANTDENGKIVHEECYVREMMVITKRPSQPIEYAS